MIIDFDTYDDLHAYQLMTQTIVPRPIAWILSLNADLQTTNLAPFSYFNILSNDPPTMMVSIGNKPDGTMKDSRINIESGRPFSINIASAKSAQNMTLTSVNLPYGVAEATEYHVPLTAFGDFLRVAECQVAYEGRYQQTIEIGNEKQGMVIFTSPCVYVDDAILEHHSKGPLIDHQAWDPIGRLGGNHYIRGGEILTVERPAYRP